jgi:hypothetical protein
MRVFILHLATAVFLITELVGLLYEKSVLAVLIRSTGAAAAIYALGMFVCLIIDKKNNPVPQADDTPVSTQGTPSAPKEEETQGGILGQIKEQPQKTAHVIDALINQ